MCAHVDARRPRTGRLLETRLRDSRTIGAEHSLAAEFDAAVSVTYVAHRLPHAVHEFVDGDFRGQRWIRAYPVSNRECVAGIIEAYPSPELPARAGADSRARPRPVSGTKLEDEHFSALFVEFLVGVVRHAQRNRASLGTDRYLHHIAAFDEGWNRGLEPNTLPPGTAGHAKQIDR